MTEPARSTRAMTPSVVSNHTESPSPASAAVAGTGTSAGTRSAARWSTRARAVPPCVVMAVVSPAVASSRAPSPRSRTSMRSVTTHGLGGTGPTGWLVSIVSSPARSTTAATAIATTTAAATSTGPSSSTGERVRPPPGRGRAACGSRAIGRARARRRALAAPRGPRPRRNRSRITFRAPTDRRRSASPCRHRSC